MTTEQKNSLTVEYPLTASIIAHGETVSKLDLRRPSPNEAKKIGRLPYVFLDDKGRMTPDMSVIPDYIVVCAGIPASSVDQMDLFDLNQLAWAIVGFFNTPASAASSS